MRWHFTLALIILQTFFVNLLVAQNNSISPQIKISYKSLSNSQVLNKYKQILSNEELMEDYDNDYIDLFPDFSDKAKKLVIEIYNENQSWFESLWDSVKAQVYNAIFFAVASISKPKIYWWIEAKNKLNEAIVTLSLTTRAWGKLLQLKSFFEQHWEEFEQLAKNNSEELKKQLFIIAQKEKKVSQKEKKLAQKAIEYKKYADKVDKYADKVDRLTKMVNQLKWLLD